MLDNELIGLFGGAFDPIHNAHISIAEKCVEEIGLQKIIFIPTGSSANNKKLTNYKHRLEMINLICNNPNFQVSDFEIREYINKKKISYTIDTLRFFSKQKKCTFFFILGSDAFSSINSWHKWKELLKYSHIIIIERANNKLYSDNMPTEVQAFFENNLTKDINDLKKYSKGYIFVLPIPMYKYSSSEVKSNLKNNTEIKSMLPKIVQEYISSHKLYLDSGHIK